MTRLQLIAWASLATVHTVHTQLRAELTLAELNPASSSLMIADSTQCIQEGLLWYTVQMFRHVLTTSQEDKQNYVDLNKFALTQFNSKYNKCWIFAFSFKFHVEPQYHNSFQICDSSQMIYCGERYISNKFWHWALLELTMPIDISNTDKYWPNAYKLVNLAK